MGVNKVRLTGGEPLVRRDLHRLVAGIAEIPGIQDIGMTTNGILLGRAGPGPVRRRPAADQHQPRCAQRGKVQTDHPPRRIRESHRGHSGGTRRRVRSREGQRRLGAGHDRRRDRSVRPFRRETGVEVRFIEFMPLDAGNAWEREQGAVRAAKSSSSSRTTFGRWFRSTIRPAAPRPPSSNSTMASGASVSSPR